MSNSSVKTMSLGEYSGKTIQRLRIQNILLTENYFPPNLSIDEHSHAYPHFTLMLDGSFTETYEGKQFLCEKGSVLIVPEGLPHTDVIGPNGAHSLSIEISRSLVKFLSSESEILVQPRVVCDHLLQARTLSLRKLFNQSPSSSHFEIHSAAMQVILGVFQAARSIDDKKQPKWLTRVLHELESSIARPPTVKDLAKIAGVSPAHLSRTFLLLYGKTIREHHRHRRLTAAAQKVVNSTTCLADIAASSGFCDQAHFTKSFKQHFGMTPSEYRISKP